jgi:hypothetical protein
MVLATQLAGFGSLWRYLNRHIRNGELTLAESFRHWWLGESDDLSDTGQPVVFLSSVAPNVPVNEPPPTAIGRDNPVVRPWHTECSLLTALEAATR